MPIGSMATWIFRVLRRTSTVLEPTPAAASMPLTTVECPEQGGFVEFVIEGSTALTGTITISGTQGGAPATEIIQVVPVTPTRAIVRSCGRFACLTGITTTGLADESPAPTISARFIGSGGESIMAVQRLAECVYGHLEQSNASWQPSNPGSYAKSLPVVIDHDDWYDFEPRRGDLYIEQQGGIDGQVWEIIGTPIMLGALASHHWELRAQPAENRPITVTTASP